MDATVPWILTLPYFEGKLITLVQRMDLSVIFPEQAAELHEYALSAAEPAKFDPELLKVDPSKVKADTERLQGDLHPNKVAQELHHEKLADKHPVLDREGRIKDAAPYQVWLAVISTASTMSVWFVLVLAAAIFYRSSKNIVSVDLNNATFAFKGDNFKHGPFDCLEDMDVCCWSFLCPAVLWSDSASAVGALHFWVALLIFVLLQFLNVLTGILAWGVAALVFTYYRQDMRRRFGLQNDTTDLPKDVAMWCCCWPCAIAQEAMQVKAARKCDEAS